MTAPFPASAVGNSEATEGDDDLKLPEDYRGCKLEECMVLQVSPSLPFWH